VRDGHSFAAITDHGTLGGTVEFYEEMKKANLRPILGIEAYVRYESKTYHQILLAKDMTGYKNLMAMIKSSTPTYGAEGRVKLVSEFSDLHKFSDGTVALSACLGGVVPQAIMAKKDGAPVRPELLIGRFKEIFGDDYYLEFQYSGIDEQVIVNRELLKYCDKFDIKPVVTVDCHYLEKEHWKAHDLFVRTARHLDVTKQRAPAYPGNPDYYVKTQEEIKKDWGKEFTDPIYEIADKCNVEIELGQDLMPSLYAPAEAVEQFKTKCWGGFQKKFPGKEKGTPECDRLVEEVDTIIKMGFVDYFLIAMDIVHHAEEEHIVHGAGRGSAAGSIVSYCLGITDIHPLKHGLLFSRFLNPARCNPPDIDLDFSRVGRDKVIDYILDKYGRDKTAIIGANLTCRTKRAFIDVCRMLGAPTGTAVVVAKTIPEETNIRDIVGKDKNLTSFVDETLRRSSGYISSIGEFCDVINLIVGTHKNISKHPAAVVISKVPLDECIPSFKLGERTYTQYDMNAVEKIGACKMDILALGTLDVVSKVMNDIGIKSFEEIGMDDPAVFEFMHKGHLLGIFQLDGSAARIIRSLNEVSSVDELADVISVIRPVAVDAKQDIEYVKRKNEEIPITYSHKELEPILAGTCGIIIYQEDIIRIAMDIAGLSAQNADLLRHGIGKKIKEEVDVWCDRFIQGCISHSKWTKEDAEQLWALIEPASRYSFNKCLPAEAMIYDADARKYIPLLESVGKKVLSLDNDGRIVYNNIIGISHEGLHMVYEVKMSDGKFLCTIGHKIMTDSGLKPLSEVLLIDGCEIVFVDE